MNLQKKLDMAIKASEVPKENLQDGYVINGRKTSTYMTNAEWEDLILGMNERVRDEYGQGSGGELKETRYPPKMACYGSSSRMLYNLSAHKKEFHYEKKLSTTVGGVANIDGFMEQRDRYIFVEAKCREPYHTSYSDSTPCVVSNAYKELYEYINESMAGAIFCNMQPHPQKHGYMNVTYMCDGDTVEYFDLKQMISHLLGIGTELLRKRLDGRRIDFMYLIYDPTELPLDADTMSEVLEIYEKLRMECVCVDVNSLFLNILTYLRDIRSVGDMSDDEIERYMFDLTFTVCDQQFFSQLIEEQM